MVYYSALHWAKKAEKSAENSAKSEENVQNISQEIENSKNEGLSAINSAKDEAIHDILLQTNTFSRNIGEIVQSTIPLTDAGLHLLDGSIIYGDGIYADFVNYIKNLANNHPNLFEKEEAWQNYVKSYGVCGKFVYDSTNNTVRLPKITGFIEGTIHEDTLGQLVPEGLPTHTHSIGRLNLRNSSNGDFAVFGNTGSLGGWGIAPASKNNAGASQLYISGNTDLASDEIYGRTMNVQPQAIKVFYYIVVATLIKTDTEINTDNIITELNKKINNQDAVHKSGEEEINGKKTFTDEIIANADITYSPNYGQLRLIHGKYGVILRNDESELHFLPTKENDQYGVWDAAKIGCSMNLDGGYFKSRAIDAINSVITTAGISKSSNAIGLKLGNGIIINSLVIASQGTAYTWKIPFTNTNYIVVTTTTSGISNFTRTTTTISCNDFNHGESSKPSNVMAIAIGY